jgi:hypothetical protein
LTTVEHHISRAKTINMKSFVVAGIYASAALALPQAQQPALPPGMANVPKGLGSIVVPNGPAPKGCNQYEVIVGMLFIPQSWRN